MNIVFSSDQKNQNFNSRLLNFFSNENLIVEDLSFLDAEKPNYIMEGLKIGETISIREGDIGIIVSNTPCGAIMAANKVSNIRCVGIFNEKMAKEAKRTFNSNVIVLPADNIDEVINWISIFLSTKYNKKKYNHGMTTLMDYEVSCTDC